MIKIKYKNTERIKNSKSNTMIDSIENSQLFAKMRKKMKKKK